MARSVTGLRIIFAAGSVDGATTRRRSAQVRSRRSCPRRRRLGLVERRNPGAAAGAAPHEGEADGRLLLAGRGSDRLRHHLIAPQGQSETQMPQSLQ
jgi:hypothetical protein